MPSGGCLCTEVQMNVFLVLDAEMFYRHTYFENSSV